MNRSINFLFLSVVISTALTSCIYRMPDDGEYTTIPVTNNPQLTNDPGTPTIPGAEY